MPSKLFNSEGRHSRVRALSGNESEEKKRVHPSYFSLNAGGTAGISRPGMSVWRSGTFLFSFLFRIKSRETPDSEERKVSLWIL